MALTDLAYDLEEFPYLVFFPAGRKNKFIRSIHNKVRKESLPRIHGIVERIMDRLAEEDVQALRNYVNVGGSSVLPILVDKEGELYLGGFVKPELFLFQTFQSEHGLPIHKEYVYETKINMMSNEQLENLLEALVDQYLYCAKLKDHTQSEWVNYIENQFEAHPLVMFAKSKEAVLTAVEEMNRSNLLSVLKYPDDISYWRHRVEIVMRPFRLIPSRWLWSSVCACEHEKALHVHADKRQLELYCERCDYSVYLEEYGLRLAEEFDIEKAKKRIHTIERQFNEIAAKNEGLLDKVKRLRSIQEQIHEYEQGWAHVESRLQDIQALPKQKSVQPTSPIIELFTQVNQMTIPIQTSSSALIWLSQVKLPSVKVFKKVEEWEVLLSDEVNLQLEELEMELRDYLEDNKITSQEEFVKVNKQSLYWGEVEQVLQFVHERSGIYPAHIITQVLIGKATNKIRTEKLDQSLQFGALQNWLEKDAMKALKTLEKDGWLRKLRKGFALTDKATLFIEKAG